MELQIEYGQWITGDSRIGGFVLPLSLVNEGQFRKLLEAAAETGDYNEVLEAIQDYLEYRTEVWDVEIVSGYGARLSEPGYLDCTEWSVFPTAEEAREYMTNMYDLDEE